MHFVCAVNGRGGPEEKVDTAVTNVRKNHAGTVHGLKTSEKGLSSTSKGFCGTSAKRRCELIDTSKCDTIATTRDSSCVSDVFDSSQKSVVWINKRQFFSRCAGVITPQPQLTRMKVVIILSECRKKNIQDVVAGERKHETWTTLTFKKCSTLPPGGSVLLGIEC